MSSSHQYYDKPDGQDVYGKMFVTNKYAMIAGLGWGTVDSLFLSKPQGYLPTLGRYVFFTAPFMGMASAFTIVTYTATRMRGKDDTLNYVLGAMSAGGVLGAWKRSVLAGLIAGGAFSIMGAVKKLSLDEGWKFFPDFNSHAVGNLMGVRHDWTLMKERPKNWTAGEK